MSKFKEINPEEIDDNAFKLIGSDWMLITAGSIDSYNMMTASWGGLGILWGRKICFCVLRPQRYTRECMEKAENFSLSFFDEKHRSVLEYCGSKSGRHVDKMAIDGITPVAAGDTVYFDEARLVLVCRKIYYQDITPKNFIDPTIDENYPKKDYHRMYVGEVIRCLVR